MKSLPDFPKFGCGLVLGGQVNAVTIHDATILAVCSTLVCLPI